MQNLWNTKWIRKIHGILLNKKSVFNDSMQFMNSSLDKLVKNLSIEDFKYLIEEIGSKNLELLKQKGAYPCKHMNSFEKFNEEKLPAKKYFYSSTKDAKISMMVKYQAVT